MHISAEVPFTVMMLYVQIRTMRWIADTTVIRIPYKEGWSPMTVCNGNQIQLQMCTSLNERLPHPHHLSDKKAATKQIVD